MTKPSGKALADLWGRVPPQNLDAEREVIGNLMRDPATIDPVLEILDGGDFYVEAHRLIFEAARTLHRRGDPVQIVSLRAELDKTKAGEAVLSTTVAECGEVVASGSAAKYYAGIVRELARRRRLLEKVACFFARADGRNADTLALDLSEIIEAERKAAPAIVKLSTFAEISTSLPDVRWAWLRNIPYGLLMVLASKPGEGKSAIALEIVRRFLTGEAWPDGSPGPAAGPVIYLETEGAGAILAERVRKWKIPQDRLYLFTVSDPTPGLATVLLDRADDWAHFEKAVLETGPALVVVDSLSGAHAIDENSAELRGLLLKLARLAAASGAAFLVIHHLRKKSALEADTVTLDRLRGSSAIPQLARVIWALDRPDENDERRRFFQIKNNLGRFTDPWGVEVGDTGVTFSEAPSAPHVETLTEKAALFLRNLLGGGPLPAAEVLDRAKAAGFGEWVTRKAANLIRVDMGRPETFGGPHFWRLPNQAAK